MKTITIATAKGESGKTTIASALAVRAARDFKRVAMLDLNVDQGTLTNWWMTRGKPDNPHCFSDVDDVGDGWDWLFIDGPPLDLDIIELSIMLADAVIIPVKASIFDIGSIDPVVEICSDRHKPFAFVMSDVDGRYKGLNNSAIEALTNHGNVLSVRISHKLGYVNAITIGKTGPEIDKSLEREIDRLWADVKRLGSVNTVGMRMEMMGAVQ